MKSITTFLKRCISTGFRRWHSTGKLTSTSPEELAHFNALASSWWDVNGPQRILHKMNLLRMDFIYSTIREHLKLNPPDCPEEDKVYIPPYSVDLLPEPIKRQIVWEQDMRRDEILSQKKLKVLDVGCGGGILSESMARSSFVDDVMGIDLSSEVLQAAKIHQQKDPMLSENNGKLDYQLTAIEDLPKSETYDIITMFEMLEHVDYPSKVLTEGLQRLNVGGWLFLSTINRDFVSWFTTIFMGEHVLRIVPVGTHTLEKYINQQEIRDWISEDPQRLRSYEVVDTKGTVYLPAYGWKFTSNPNVGNYFMALRRVK
ncbi:Hexaprenyldihydroxybenzoate methyltransferase, mitochondrial [Scheffersomyces spartinae]|uniref:Ubiquinone biosynthesis O-methyltransferase, mitochondrial n=1 Tax=Scheffersomyces spartinae TaxID=45513 RepID=A0A9P7V9C2_9ASCO|nr:Hexaprenyldihydroxybenzoate methyltransferase, mitochondrial [Scheffersomyces spartinae]KAG7193762.1 Hexaprenyldihydroxybenzoate methyltransferase, mitochondrial [Scheffersomyces spartinae]